MYLTYAYIFYVSKIVQVCPCIRMHNYANVVFQDHVYCIHTKIGGYSEMPHAIDLGGTPRALQFSGQTPSQPSVS